MCVVKTLSKLLAGLKKTAAASHFASRLATNAFLVLFGSFNAIFSICLLCLGFFLGGAGGQDCI